jgi:hypothetical protein
MGTIGSYGDADGLAPGDTRMADQFNQVKISVTPADITLRTAYLAAAFCSAIVVIYEVSSAQPAPAVVLFMSFAPIVAVCAWLQKDARTTGISSVHDWGFFLYLAWPFLIPWYALKTRGRSGWKLAGMLLGLACAPMMAAFVIAIVQAILSLA